MIETSIITLTKAQYAGEFRIWLEFNTGESGEVNLREIIERYSCAQPLKDQTAFRQFYLDEWPTLAWPCGFDISPETLYKLATGKTPTWLISQKPHAVPK